MQISLGSYHVIAVLSTRPTRSYWVLFRTWWEPDATTFILNMSKVNVEVHDFLLPFRLLLGPYCVSTGSSVRLWSSHCVYNSFSQISERSKIFDVWMCDWGIKTNSYSKFQVNITKKKQLERKVRKNKIFAKGNYSSKSGSNETKVELDLYYVKTNPYTKCQVNISKDDWEKFGKPSGRKTEWTDGRTDRGRVNIVPRCHR